MPATLQLSMAPQDARKLLHEIQTLQKPRPNRPRSLASPPELNEHGLFLYLLNSRHFRGWLATVTPENSFQYMRILCEIQSMGLRKFRKWLEREAQKIDPKDPNDPRGNQRFFDEQFAIQQGVIVLSENIEEMNIARNQRLHLFGGVIIDALWVESAAENYHADPGLLTQNGSLLISELAASLAGVKSEHEATTNPAVSKAAHRFRALLNAENSPHQRDADIAPKLAPPSFLVEDMKKFEDNEEA